MAPKRSRATDPRVPAIAILLSKRQPRKSSVIGSRNWPPGQGLRCGQAGIKTSARKILALPSCQCQVPLNRRPKAGPSWARFLNAQSAPRWRRGHDQGRRCHRKPRSRSARTASMNDFDRAEASGEALRSSPVSARGLAPLELSVPRRPCCHDRGKRPTVLRLFEVDASAGRLHRAWRHAHRA